MGSPKVKDREKKINEIRRLNGLSSFKGSEYKAMNDRDKINQKIFNEEFDFEYYEDDDITLPDGQKINDISEIERQYAATESFFGISFDKNKTLLHEISCKDYELGKTIYNYKIGSTKKDLEEFDNDISEQLEKIEKTPYIKNIYDITDSKCYIDIREKYKDWEEYCLFVDHIKGFIDAFIPGFDKFRGDKKFEWINKLSGNYITEDIAEYINDYHLNEHTKAKIDKLMDLQLPNLTEVSNVSKFVHFYIKQK